MLQKVLHLKYCIYNSLLALERRFVALVALLFKSIIRENIKKPIFLFILLVVFIYYIDLRKSATSATF